MQTILWISGGLSVGLGMVTLISGGFNQPHGEVAVSFSKLGFDALPVLTFPTPAMVGIALIAIGAAMMIKVNATAWKQTGGY